MALQNLALISRSAAFSDKHISILYSDCLLSTCSISSFQKLHHLARQDESNVIYYLQSYLSIKSCLRNISYFPRGHMRSSSIESIKSACTVDNNTRTIAAKQAILILGRS